MSSTGGLVQALWQAPLIQARVVGDLVVGLAAGHGVPDELRALSELTGQPAWSALLPAAEPDVLGLATGAGVIVAEVGRDVGSAPAAVVPVVTHDVVFDAASGHELWSVPVANAAAARLQHQPLALTGQLMVTGDATGDLTARNALSGSVVWHQPRPASCTQAGQDEDSYDEGLAADGNLLVVSYQCDTGGRSFVLVRRLSVASGATQWQWRSIRVADTPESFIGLSVVGAARRGDLVLLSGQVARAKRLADLLPHPRTWPKSLGAFGEDELLVALDGHSGRPLWSEQGGQLLSTTLTDGVVCETVTVGFECRQDRDGALSRPLVRTTRTEGNSPPYIGDGYAGISGDLAGVVLSQSAGGATSMVVFPLRGRGRVASATVELDAGVYEGANYQSFIVGAGPLPGGATLMLLRRVDVAGYPLVALSVTPARRPLSEPPPPGKPKSPPAKRGTRVYVANADCRGRAVKPSRITLDCSDPSRLYLTEVAFFPGAGETYGTEHADASMTIHAFRCHPDCAKGRFLVEKGALTLERIVRCEDGFFYYSRALYAFPEGKGRVDIQPREHCRTVRRT